MKRCANCQRKFLFGGRTLNGAAYCSKECLEFASAPAFCATCQSETQDVSTGNLLSVNLIGEAFLGSGRKCPTCHSVEKYMFFIMVFPVLPLGKWKLKYVAPGRFITRKVKNTRFPDAARRHLPKGKGRISPVWWIAGGAFLFALLFSYMSKA